MPRACASAITGVERLLERVGGVLPRELPRRPGREDHALGLRPPRRRRRARRTRSRCPSHCDGSSRWNGPIPMRLRHADARVAQPPRAVLDPGGLELRQGRADRGDPGPLVEREVLVERPLERGDRRERDAGMHGCRAVIRATAARALLPPPSSWRLMPVRYSRLGAREVHGGMGDVARLAEAGEVHRPRAGSGAPSLMSASRRSLTHVAGADRVAPDARAAPPRRRWPRVSAFSPPLLVAYAARPALGRLALARRDVDDRAVPGRPHVRDARPGTATSARSR